MFKVIGIAGPAQCGKSTVAEMLQEHLPDYEIIAFADPIKHMLATGLHIHSNQLWGDHKEVIDPDYGLTAREMMQRLGTEWGRDMIHPDIWVKALHKHRGDLNIIIPDVRFQNEVNYCRRHGTLIHITGRNVPITNADHRSESGVITNDKDYFINNSLSLNVLSVHVKQLVEYWQK